MDSELEGAGEWGDVNSDGWVVLWKIWGSWGSKDGEMVPETDSRGRGLCGKSRFIVGCSATDETYKNIPVVA